MKSGQSTVLSIISILLLFLAAQATRFESDVKITYLDGNFTAILDGNVLNLPVEENFTQISAQLQKAMLAENGVGSFFISSDNQVLAEYNPLVIHLFGKDITGTLLKGIQVHPIFKKTFGDWIKDRFISDPVFLYNASLPSHFSMELTFVGRGYKHMSFYGQQNVFISINDGYLDNNYSLCYAGKCVVVDYKELVFTNVKRVTNFFIEVFLLALIMVLLVKLIARRADSK